MATYMGDAHGSGMTFEHTRTGLRQRNTHLIYILVGTFECKTRKFFGSFLIPHNFSRLGDRRYASQQSNRVFFCCLVVVACTTTTAVVVTGSPLVTRLRAGTDNNSCWVRGADGLCEGKTNKKLKKKELSWWRHRNF